MQDHQSATLKAWRVQVPPPPCACVSKYIRTYLYHIVVVCTVSTSLLPKMSVFWTHITRLKTFLQLDPPHDEFGQHSLYEIPTIYQTVCYTAAVIATVTEQSLGCTSERSLSQQSNLHRSSFQVTDYYNKNETKTWRPSLLSRTSGLRATTSFTAPAGEHGLMRFSFPELILSIIPGSGYGLPPSLPFIDLCQIYVIRSILLYPRRGLRQPAVTHITCSFVHCLLLLCEINKTCCSASNISNFMAPAHRVEPTSTYRYSPSGTCSYSASYRLILSINHKRDKARGVSKKGLLD